jgi:phosphopantothenoylcysteine decarboxylase/phosphopantothenate--cysteine ligase
MKTLKDKRVLIGVSGSIAAYKIAFLVRLLIKQGAQVKVLMTASAKAFIPPVTLATLSKEPVISDFYKNESGEWHNHVELGLWADVFVVAPASANTIAKMANGICDNILLATYLSARCKVMFAPAMDLDMYQHPAVQNNIAKLQTYGNHFIEAETGELASGLEGKGRMAEPETILQHILHHFGQN